MDSKNANHIGPESPVSRINLALILGVSQETISRLLRDGVFKQSIGKKYKLGEAVQAYNEYIAGGREVGNKAQDERRKLLIAQTEKINLEISEKRNELISFDHATQTLTEAMVIVSSQLEGLPGRVASKVLNIDNAAVARQIILKEIRRIRESAGRKLKELAGSYESGEHNDSTADKISQSMG